VKSVLGREFVPVDRSIDVHISNLRKKLGSAPDGGNRIRNVRSVGYIYVIPGASKKR
jgi:two-component system response regulator CpxR